MLHKTKGRELAKDVGYLEEEGGMKQALAAQIVTESGSMHTAGILTIFQTWILTMTLLISDYNFEQFSHYGTAWLQLIATKVDMIQYLPVWDGQH